MINFFFKEMFSLTMEGILFFMQLTHFAMFGGGYLEGGDIFRPEKWGGVIYFFSLL